MKGTKRVYAPRTASRPAVKRQSIGRQLLRLKETKRLVTESAVSAYAAGGTYVQLFGDVNGLNDPLQGDQGLIVGAYVRILATASTSVGNFARVLLIKGKRDQAIDENSLIWLDAAQSKGRSGTSTEVTLLEQMVAPINREGFVCKFDKALSVGGTDEGPSTFLMEKYVPFSEIIQVYDDTGDHSANYYIAVFAHEADGTDSTINLRVQVELLYKDKV